MTAGDARRPLDLNGFDRWLEAHDLAEEDRYRPLFIRLGVGEAPACSELCDRYRIRRVDAIDSQLAELSEVRYPASDAVAERTRFVADEIEAAGDISACGRWVYFPWVRRLSHILGAQAFFDVITSRNQDKITREEQLSLRERRVGVVGLSVGGEAAVSLAQEHLCGSIALADFDELELSNLNRLNSGVDDLGENKAHLIARRIAHIDPYLEVEVFANGVNSGNVDRFLDGLDLLVEECDDFAMKWRMRELARERGINLVFAADERGMLSVEPYAHQPDLQLFHDRIREARSGRDAYASQTEFMRSLTEWLGGWDTISERSRQSVERIGVELCGYPQLASEPRLAAGQIGHVARRLLLGEPLAPQLHHYDLEAELRT